MPDLTQFKEYYALSHQLIETLSREELAECLRALALQVADYESRFGKIEREDLLQLLGATTLNEKQVALLTRGMEILTGHLAIVRSLESNDGMCTEGTDSAVWRRNAVSTSSIASWVCSNGMVQGRRDIARVR